MYIYKSKFMKADIYNIEGSKTGKSIDLPDGLFGVEPNEHAVYLAVKQYNAHQRQGTHKAKERGEIKGSTKKIKRQKGTGTARAGSIKNPLFKGGGRIFGPRPRNYSIKLNKKVKAIARASALSSKMNNGEIVVLEDFTFEAPKTSAYINILKNHEADDLKSLLVTGEHDTNIFLSSRNCQKANVTTASSLNVYSILGANKIFISESAVNKLKEIVA